MSYAYSVTSNISGRKYDAGKLAVDMHHELLPDGTRMFSKDEYLTAQQITSYWSCYAATVRARGASAWQQALQPEISQVPLNEYRNDPNVPDPEAELIQAITC